MPLILNLNVFLSQFLYMVLMGIKRELIKDESSPRKGKKSRRGQDSAHQSDTEPE